MILGKGLYNDLPFPVCFLWKKSDFRLKIDQRKMSLLKTGPLNVSAYVSNFFPYESSSIITWYILVLLSKLSSSWHTKKGRETKFNGDNWCRKKSGTSKCQFRYYFYLNCRFTINWWWLKCYKGLKNWLIYVLSLSFLRKYGFKV